MGRTTPPPVSSRTLSGAPAARIDDNLPLHGVLPTVDPSEVILVQITLDHYDFAVRLATVLVEEHLVAGARVLPPHMALSLPDGSLQAASQVLLTALTTVGDFAALSARVHGQPGVQPPGVLGILVPLMDHGVFEWVRTSTLRGPQPELALSERRQDAETGSGQ
jgi:uncharacterized protein involved in tolerance to divalent cations